jgi:opacity protein-like surface antigen
MNKIFFALLCCFYFTATQAQINELGFFAGGSNFIGDVGSAAYINPNSPAIGLVYKWNKSPRHSWRFSYTQAKLIGNDKNSNDIQRQNRNLSFQNNIKELSGGIEFNFFDFDLNKKLDKKVSPYFFTGLSFLLFKQMEYTSSSSPIANSVANQVSSGKSFAIPLIIGVKSNLTSNFVLGFEIGTRYTFTDDLDGNLTSFNLGNVNNKDWYVFSGFTLTYMFGTKPCFCAE